MNNLLLVPVFAICTLFHGLLLLNPFWFRERALQAFGRHRYAKYFSVLSRWF